jgi:hypothetical protein
MQDEPISRISSLQGLIIKFESKCEDWVDGRLTQSDATAIFDQCDGSHSKGDFGQSFSCTLQSLFGA